jgi:hypothetical protein
MFKSKYGQGVDFSGYIDKFYSRHVFDFMNRNQVSDFMREVFRSFLIDRRLIGGGGELLTNVLGREYYIATIEFLGLLVSNGALSLRNVLMCGEFFTLNIPGIEFDGRPTSFSSSPYLLYLPTIFKVCGGIDHFLDSLDLLEKANVHLGYHYLQLNTIFYLATYKQHKFGNQPDPIVEFRGNFYIISTARDQEGRPILFDVYTTADVVPKEDPDQQANLTKREKILSYSDDEIYNMIRVVVGFYKTISPFR